MGGAAVGIDVGATGVHVVRVESGFVTATARLGAADLSPLDDLCRGVQVAIDAPDAPSTAPHAGDETLVPKLRTGRCGEIAAAVDHRIWVSWVTPVLDAPPWMATGFAVWDRLRSDGHDPMEVYPYGAFLLLNRRRRLPKKQTVEGQTARHGLLEPFVALPRDVGLWSHDGVDALVAAVVAGQRSAGAVPAGHDGPGCDGSVLWLPSPHDDDRP